MGYRQVLRYLALKGAVKKGVRIRRRIRPPNMERSRHGNGLNQRDGTTSLVWPESLLCLGQNRRLAASASLSVCAVWLSLREGVPYPKKNSRISKATYLRGTNEQPRSASSRTCLPSDADDADPVARSSGGAGDACCRQIRPCRSCRRRPQEHRGTGRGNAFSWTVNGPVLASAHEPWDLCRGHNGPVSTNRVERHASKRSSRVDQSFGHDAGRTFCLGAVRRARTDGSNRTAGVRTPIRRPILRVPGRACGGWRRVQRRDELLASLPCCHRRCVRFLQA